MSQVPGYYTVTEAALIIGKTPIMIRKYIRTGLLTGKRIGKSWIIEQAQVHTFKPNPRGNPNFGKK